MTTEPIWAALAAHQTLVADRPILSLFETNPDRADRFSARMPGQVGAATTLLFDFSKTNLDATALDLLVSLARAAGVEARREAMFSGAPINETEGRAVLHTMLRGTPDPAIPAIWRDDMERTRERLRAFARALRAGTIQGQGGRITDVINIGIGGSDLGPAMASLALAPWHDGPRVHFLSNVDGAHATDLLRGLDPTRTLVIIASKTFTTIETMTNAATVRDWMAPAVQHPAKQMVAVSSAAARAAEWGIPAERVFGFGDYIGGRYSVWGPVGLALMLAIGPDPFDAFLAGAAEIDSHFRHAPLAQNLPVLLALTGIWHHQICGYASRAVLPYDQRLARLPAYLQQLEMESNGKGVAMDGSPLIRPSGPLVWGEPGTNGQHAFYQLIHQGTSVVPCEFLIAAQGHEPALAQHQRLLIANCLAQSEALMRGRTLDQARALMARQGLQGAELERQARHRVFPGNRPSVTLAYDRLDPAMLGRLLALYEHRVFVEGVVLGLNSFDQWGVELGKELAVAIAPLLTPGADDSAADGSTRLLLAQLRR